MNVRDAFEILRQDVNERLKKHVSFKTCSVGDVGPSNYGKDHGMDDGIYKFKIYMNGESYPSTNYYSFSREYTEIDDYPHLTDIDKEQFVSNIILELTGLINKETK